MSSLDPCAGEGRDRPTRVAVLSLHTSPLVQPGSGDSGGMNVYVRELVAALAHVGVCGTVYVRRWSRDLPRVVGVEPGVRVVHVDAGHPDLPKEELPGIVDAFTRGVVDDIVATGGTDAVHANYWLSGVAGHAIKHELDLPLVSTFHTLARVKAENGDPEPQRRVAEETRVVACSDRITASCVAEAHQLQRLYGAPADRIELVAPGVDHALFSPGDRTAARRALGLDDRPTLLFVGRIQPLKGLGVAVAALAALEDETARLVVVGGPSGPDGPEEFARVLDLIAAHGLTDRVVFVRPQPHHLLSTYYRAADVCVVPSRSESFGLVALEASACGTPVVAAAVGGLRTLVDHGRTGFLVESRDPARYGAFIDEILANPIVAAEMAMDAATTARAYTWSTTAERLAGVYRELTSSQLVDCAM